MKLTQTCTILNVFFFINENCTWSAQQKYAQIMHNYPNTLSYLQLWILQADHAYASLRFTQHQ